MKNRGSFLVETLVAMMLFLIGVLALTSAITFSLTSIMKSKEALGTDMIVVNKVENEIMKQSVSPDYKLQNGSPVLSATVELRDALSNDHWVVPLNIYRFSSDEKFSTIFYLAERP